MIIIHVPPCDSNAPSYIEIKYVVYFHVTIQLQDLKDIIPCCLFTLLFIPCILLSIFLRFLAICTTHFMILKFSHNQFIFRHVSLVVTNCFNNGVLAYKTNSLLVVVATTETCRNMD
jgi:hypothetical protein